MRVQRVTNAIVLLIGIIASPSMAVVPQEAAEIVLEFSETNDNFQTALLRFLWKGAVKVAGYEDNKAFLTKEDLVLINIDKIGEWKKRNNLKNPAMSKETIENLVRDENKYTFDDFKQDWLKTTDAPDGLKGSELDHIAYYLDKDKGGDVIKPEFDEQMNTFLDTISSVTVKDEFKKFAESKNLFP